MIEFARLAHNAGTDRTAPHPLHRSAVQSLLPSQLWLSADVRQPATQLHMLRFLERYTAALPACDHARLGALTVTGEHGAALRLLARRMAFVTGDGAIPDASATALALAASVFGDDRAAFELAVLAGSLAVRIGRGGDPAGFRSQRRMFEAAGWALGELINQGAIDWRDALERFDRLRDGDPLSRQDKEIRR